MDFKPIIIDFVERVHREVIALIVDLTDEERESKGGPGAWTPKDNIAHISFWTRNMGENLAATAQGKEPQYYENVQETNEANFEKFRQLTWEQVFDMEEEATSVLTAAVESLDEESLLNTEFFHWQTGRPLWMMVIGTGYIHPIFHLASVYTVRDNLDQADRLQEESFNLLKDLDEGEQWQGLLTYNLACHYALTGQKEKAIHGLKDALELRPDLTNWSKEDPDLEAIRGEPGYHSLFTN